MTCADTEECLSLKGGLLCLCRLLQLKCVTVIQTDYTFENSVFYEVFQLAHLCPLKPLSVCVCVCVTQKTYLSCNVSRRT